MCIKTQSIDTVLIWLPMSFSFGFTEDILSDDELTNVNTTGNQITEQEQQEPIVNPLDIPNPSAKTANLESLQQLLKSLKDVRVTFETYTTPANNVVFRRELYDVKHQLMNEDDDVETQTPTTQNTEEGQILLTQQSSDLTKNVYEGGFKSWECSIDTVDKLSSYNDEQLFRGDVIELGCGTALPSTFLFKRALISGVQNIKLILSDYNASVLRLVTLPNLIITWASTLPVELLIALQTQQNPEIPLVDDELQFTEALLTRFVEDLQAKNIELALISGAWSREFLNIYKDVTGANPFGVLISSETIYSPETLPVLTELLSSLFQLNTITKSSNVGLGFIAAKDIYFGVGGSLVEFEQYLEKIMKRENVTQWGFETEKVNAGLQRSIVLIGSK